MFSPKISFKCPVMFPTARKFDRIAFHNIYKPMLFIDASGISIWVTAQLFVRRRRLKGILFKSR